MLKTTFQPLLPFNYPHRQSWLAWAGCLAPSVCLSVHIITQKQMIPECSNLVQGMTLGYTRNGMVLGLKSQRTQGQ